MDQILKKKLSDLKQAKSKSLKSEMLIQSGLGSLGRKMTFNAFASEKGKVGAYKYANSWELGSRGILFYGPTGVGKTHLGCAIANKMIYTGTFAKFMRTVELPKHDSDAIQELTDPDVVPVLILDDIGSEKGTDRALECLYNIIDGRIWNMVPTILTSNFKPDALKVRLNESSSGYGDRLLSRIKFICELVPVGGKDMRIED